MLAQVASGAENMVRVAGVVDASCCISVHGVGRRMSRTTPVGFTLVPEEVK